MRLAAARGGGGQEPQDPARGEVVGAGQALRRGAERPQSAQARAPGA